ncbi:MAG: replication protein RepA [Acidobacteriota bacterium]|nr:replication protein RepA [Acidobacteriota bacterium]
MKALKKNKMGPAVSRTVKKIADGAVAVRETQPGEEDIAYLHSVMTQVSMPRSKTAARFFERRSGNTSLRIDAGVIDTGKGYKELPLPYGSVPRYMLAHMNTFAIRNKTCEIPLGDSARDFMESIGYTVSGGKRGTYTTFRDQVIALAACRLIMSAGDGKRMPRTHVKSDIVQVFDLWTQLDGAQRVIWPGRIVLAQSYYDSLAQSAVPLNHNALVALRGSALALDIYAWLANRLHRVSERSGTFVSWESLKEQFGDEYKDDKDGRRNFRTEFRRVLETVKHLYPTAKVQDCLDKRGKPTGLILLPSPPPIAKG